jgi:hypothetical protein
VFFRKTFPQLDEVIARSLLIFPAFGATYKSDQHCWVFPSGYRFQFAHLENEGSEVAWHGKEITLLMIDQAEEIQEKQYLFLKMQVRTSDPVLRPLLGVRISANPIGRYVDWIKERFIGKHYDGGHVFVDEFTLKDGRTVTRDRVYIKATLYDNPHVNAEYEADLLGLPPDQREAYLYGRWDVHIGTFFADCWVPSIHVIQPIEISPHWEVFRMADWGSSAPAACYWAAVDQDGDIIIFDELYGPGKTGTAWAKKILEVEALYGDRFVERDPETRKVIGSKLNGPIDWAANTSNGAEGPTVVEAMHSMGVYWYPADKRRKEGLVELRERLMKRTTERKPGLRIVSHCENLIRTLPRMVADDKDPDDIAHGAKKQEDHACLVGESLIETDRGPKRLDEVAEGDAVLTRQGWKRVVCAAQTSQSAEVYEVTMSNGATLRGTADHPVWTGSRWRALRNLAIGDTVTICKSPLFQTPSRNSTESATTAADTTSSEPASVSIA